MKHYAYFDKAGKLQCESFRKALDGYRAKRAHVVLTVEEFRDTRSSPQNRYYHGVVVRLIADGLKDAGWDPIECEHEAVHMALRMRFLKTDKPLGSDGEFVTRVRSTTELNTQEFGEYLEHCKRFAAEYLGVVIPEPNEQMQLTEA